MRKTIAECLRILVPCGELWIKVPHARAPQAHGMYHLHRFNSVDMRTIGYTEDWWRTRQSPFVETMMRLNFRPRGKPCLDIVYAILGHLSKLVSPEGWEFIGLPADELEWKGIKRETETAI